jgi:hypothetical protein
MVASWEYLNLISRLICIVLPFVFDYVHYNVKRNNIFTSILIEIELRYKYDTCYIFYLRSGGEGMDSSLLKNAYGEPYLVFDVEDINEVLSPGEFWSKLPGLSLQPPKLNMWTIPLFRSFFWGFTEMEEKLVTFLVADDTVKRDGETPEISNVIGTTVEERLVIDEAMPFKPFMTGHDRQSLTYSNRYYPRRMHDFILQDYLPAYVLTEDQQFWRRAEELLAFLRYTRWKEDGTNDFVEQFYPAESHPRPDWAGGWDYVFDWE